VTDQGKGFANTPAGDCDGAIVHQCRSVGNWLPNSSRTSVPYVSSSLRYPNWANNANARISLAYNGRERNAISTVAKKGESPNNNKAPKGHRGEIEDRGMKATDAASKESTH
jgi:hypothetical protein